MSDDKKDDPPSSPTLTENEREFFLKTLRGVEQRLTGRIKATEEKLQGDFNDRLNRQSDRLIRLEIVSKNYEGAIESLNKTNEQVATLNESVREMLHRHADMLNRDAQQETRIAALEQVASKAGGRRGLVAGGIVGVIFQLFEHYLKSK